MAAVRDCTGFRAFWEAPHRPLFLAAISCALLSVAWWPLGVRLGLPGPAFEPAIAWHVHELFFGFAAAAIGGYLLTALPGWTGNQPVRGGILKLLLAFWVSARLAMALAIYLPDLVLFALNSGYFVLLSGIIGQQLVSTRAYRKLGFLLAVTALGTAEALFLTRVLYGMQWEGLEMARALLIGVVMLMVTVGTRAIPAFTNNWFAQRGYTMRARPALAAVIVMAQLALAVSMVAKLLGQDEIANGAMICAALGLLWNMRGWQCRAALANPLLAALHVSFLWLPLGLLTIGFSRLAPALYPATDAVHAVTIGAMSGLIMAISGRAAAHTELGEMQANTGLKLGFMLIWAATCIRLVAPVLVELPLTMLAAVTWCLAWIAFATGFLPALTGPLRRPVLSGRRHETLAKAPRPKG